MINDKYSAIQQLVNNSTEADIRLFITSAFADNKKLLYKFIDYINNQLSNSTPEEKYSMYEWFTMNMDNSFNTIYEDYLEKIVLDLFTEEEYRQSNIALLQHRIEAALNEEQERKRYIASRKWMLVYLKTLKKYDYDDKQIKEVCKEYWSIPESRKYYINVCISEKNYNRALRLLDESIELDSGHNELIKTYRIQKMDIYFLQGNKAAYIEELNKMASHAGKRAYYAELVLMLMKISNFEGGRSIVRDIANDWKIRYRKRPAMMEELDEIDINFKLKVS